MYWIILQTIRTLRLLSMPGGPVWALPAPHPKHNYEIAGELNNEFVKF